MSQIISIFPQMGLVQFTNSEFLNFIIADEISFLKVRVFDSMGFDKLFYVFGLKYKCNIDPSSQWHNEATKFLVYVIEFIQLFDIIWVSGLAIFAQFINQITKVFFKFILQNKILYCRASERSSASRKVKRTKLYLYLPSLKCLTKLGVFTLEDCDNDCGLHYYL